MLSPSTRSRDYGVKMRRYAAGIPWYWILDPANRSVEEYRLDATGYARISTAGPAEVFHPVRFPDLAIPVSSLWL